jgi:hypothetical protein
MSKLRNFTLQWVRGAETGTVNYRSENGQMARIRYLTEHPEMDSVTVVGKARTKGPPNFYAVGMAILSSEIRMNGMEENRAQNNR